MPSSKTTILLLVVLALGGGCGDAEGEPTSGGDDQPPASPGTDGRLTVPPAVTTESGAVVRTDGGVNSHQGQEAGAPPKAAPDQGASLWSCNEIGACADQCGINLQCMNQCAAKGCSSAKSAFNALNKCGEAKCMTACMFDPGGSGCESCINSKCAAELQACTTNKC